MNLKNEAGGLNYLMLPNLKEGCNEQGRICPRAGVLWHVENRAEMSLAPGINPHLLLIIFYFATVRWGWYDAEVLLLFA